MALEGKGGIFYGAIVKPTVGRCRAFIYVPYADEYLALVPSLYPLVSTMPYRLITRNTRAIHALPLVSLVATAMPYHSYAHLLPCLLYVEYRQCTAA